LNSHPPDSSCWAGLLGHLPHGSGAQDIAPALSLHGLSGPKRTSTEVLSAPPAWRRLLSQSRAPPHGDPKALPGGREPVEHTRCVARRVRLGSRRQVDGEDATLPWDVARADLATVCLDGLAADREPKTKARAVIFAPLPEGAKHLPFRLVVSETPALVFDLDEHARVVGLRPERHPSTSGCVLEGVLQEVHHRRREELRVPGDRQRGIDTFHRELDVAVLSVQIGGDRNLVYEDGQRYPFASVHARFQTDFGQAPVDEVAKAREAAAERRARASADADLARPKCLERQKRRVEL